MQVFNFNGTMGMGELVEINSLEEGLKLKPYAMFSVQAPKDDQFDEYVFCSLEDDILCQPVMNNIHYHSDDLYNEKAIEKFNELFK